jgi:hypothetical protein
MNDRNQHVATTDDIEFGFSSLLFNAQPLIAIIHEIHLECYYVQSTAALQPLKNEHGWNAAAPVEHE